MAGTKRSHTQLLAAVRENGLLLRDASRSQKDDREVVLAACNHHGYALRFASDAMKADREVVLLQPGLECSPVCIGCAEG